MKSGIYKITNVVNGNFYIGSSKNVLHRISRHKSTLKLNKHRNIHLQRSYNKYGIDKFLFEVIHICSEDQLRSIEQYLLDNFAQLDICYNSSLDASCPNRGRKLGPQSAEHKQKLSKPKTQEQKLMISKSKRGKVSWRKYGDDIRQKAKNMRYNGFTYQQIADYIGCAHRTARLLVNDIYQGQIL